MAGADRVRRRFTLSAKRQSRNGAGWGRADHLKIIVL